ncbi:hypothetical protein ABLV18_27525 [Klebsiella sp. CN_Kp114]|uniref:hypothetical protein n=1 Tax=unclassified Klebsiella TaxID=2608929 RepID=UPI0032B48D01
MGENISLEDAIHQRNQLAEAIGNAAVKAGIVKPGTPLTGPQLLMLVEDMFAGVPVLSMPHTWQDGEGTECVSAHQVREMLTEVGLKIQG